MNNTIFPEQNADFDLTIGKLDFVLSKLMMYAKQAELGNLSEANIQTLKHHAEDMELAAKSIFKKINSAVTNQLKVIFGELPAICRRQILDVSASKQIGGQAVFTRCIKLAGHEGVCDSRMPVETTKETTNGL